MKPVWYKFVFLGMLKVVIIGTGNVAFHLFKAFQTTDKVSVVQVVGRDKNVLSTFEDEAIIETDLKKVKQADFYLLAVSDTAIFEVAQQLRNKKGIVAHTAGSVSIDALNDHLSYGVFYPLQTFSKERPVDFSVIPICVEANTRTALARLEKLADTLSDSVYQISSKQRRQLHLSAVFVNNFPNHLFTIAATICRDHDVSFDLLKPLIGETANKIRFLDPQTAQTGPARRNDIETMQRHLDELKHPLHKKIYQLLSESIRQAHEEKL
ncbi:Rossmann-like and DUF2520 domain-containing protein [Allomuricauda sp. SCSIO 65647]|uniref:Rossmann-like and DUF2520 domain-containing protein n=1 Tax=Allomuricauda sp. SCSIO 65647 TaxID=2908843 RepID=UPI001F1E28D6|nr:Rossmann-like and DUF2520 domain-containing protein [Muricauda sp. SCSIO 65647]UJH67109.1 DUF2520 domain-containing protein [Muricauda sp. SCSIO 65647]